MPKLTGWSYGPFNGFHVQNWKFDQKYSSLMNECKSWFEHVESIRIMFKSKIKWNSWVLNAKWNTTKDEFVDPIRWGRVQSLMGYALRRNEEMVKWMESEVIQSWNFS